MVKYFSESWWITVNLGIRQMKIENKGHYFREDITFTREEERKETETEMERGGGKRKEREARKEREEKKNMMKSESWKRFLD